MNILIIAGGTGSMQLQKGLYDIVGDLQGAKTRVLVNAYDNGLSTGAVRQVAHGKILGPSDLRKNQTTLLRLVNPSSKLLPLLDTRFTLPLNEVKAFCLNEIARVAVPSLDITEMQRQLMSEAVEVYFSAKLANSIDYNDFSLANIIYAGFAMANGNSLRKAGSIMAGIMDIPEDAVILNDDTSLFLGATTKSGHLLADEADIVKWGNLEDPIRDLYFVDHLGKTANPVLCAEAENAILEADLIILSSGTQWSSLIPTYASTGFRGAIERSNSDIVMVMNRVPDKDSPGQGADEIVRCVIPRFFPEKRVKLLLDSTGDDLMKSVSQKTEQIFLKSQYATDMHTDLGSQPIHEPGKLAKGVMTLHFGELVSSKSFVFDYDDTLVARGNSFAYDSREALKLLWTLNQIDDVYICTGNSIRAININLSLDNSAATRATNINRPVKNGIKIFADGGINLYEYFMPSAWPEESKYHFVECIAPEMKFPPQGVLSISNISHFLVSEGIPRGKIENRGDVMISIKPIDPDYRDIVVKYIRNQVCGNRQDQLYSKVIVRPAGRSTIEICNKDLSKEFAVRKILSETQDAVTYIGDELYNGNDAPIVDIAKDDDQLTFLNVKNVAHTVVFLRSIMSRKSLI